MADYGVTATGFKKKSYNDLMTQFESDLKSQDLFGENIDFSEKDPMYQFTAPIIYILSELWEVAENTFYSASPKFSEGVPLSNTGKYIGIARKQGAKAYGTNALKINGDKDTIVQQGFLISTEDGIIFQTVQTVKIPDSGEILVDIEALEPGENGNVPQNTIIQIVAPIIGVNSVTNVVSPIGGQDIENDVEFRERYSKSVAQRATNIFDSIIANLLKVTGVKDVLLINNNTMSEVNGVPAKSFHTVVLGGDDNEVAKAIFERYPIGIQPFGNIIITLKDSQGYDQPVGFSRPTLKNVWIKITVTTNSQYPVDGNTLIKQAVKDYIDNFEMGQDVIIYKIISAIDKLNLQGIEDISIQLSQDGTTYNSNNITILDAEVAITTLDKIGVV